MQVGRWANMQVDLNMSTLHDLRITDTCTFAHATVRRDL